MLSKNPYVELTEGADDICENCPNNENGICTQEKSVSGNDRRTYEAIEDELKKQKPDEDKKKKKSQNNRNNSNRNSGRGYSY